MGKFDYIATAVMAVIVNEENKVLAVSRKDDYTDFGLPGGKVEKIDFNGEYDIVPIRNAIRREVREETGLDIDGLSINTVYESGVVKGAIKPTDLSVGYMDPLIVFLMKY